MIFRRLGRSGSRTEFELLLDAARTPQSGPPDPLAGLLRAAAAPPRPPELAGEQAAVAAFRAARRAGAQAKPATQPRRRRFSAGAVAWLAAVAATATAGAALAAARLDRPTGPPLPPPVPLTEPAEPRSTGADGQPSTGPSGSASTSTSPTPASSPSPSPSESTTVKLEATPPVRPGNSGDTANHAGHCRAYLSKPPRQRDKALRTPGFSELVVAADGAQNVEAYCRELLAVDPKRRADQKSAADEEAAEGSH